RLQQIFLWRLARQQRHEPAFFDQRDVLRQNPFVVDQVGPGDGTAVELLERRRVARRKRIGEDTQADAREERSRLALPLREPRVLGVGQAARQRQRQERPPQQLRAG